MHTFLIFYTYYIRDYDQQVREAIIDQLGYRYDYDNTAIMF